MGWNWTGVISAVGLSGCVVLVESPPPLVVPIIMEATSPSVSVSVEQHTVPTPSPAPVIERVEVPVVSEIKEVSGCSFYDKPPFPPVPEIARPESIDRLSYQDSEALLVEHIFALRDYINEIKTEHEVAYRAYLQDC